LENLDLVSQLLGQNRPRNNQHEVGVQIVRKGEYMLEIVRFEIRRYAQNDLITQDWAKHLIQQRMTSQPILEPWSGNLMMFLQEFDAVRCCAIGFKADGLTLGVGLPTKLIKSSAVLTPCLASN